MWRSGNVKNKIIYKEDQTRTTLGQLCAALWDSQSQSCDTAWIRTRDCSDASCTEIRLDNRTSQNSPKAENVKITLAKLEH